MVEAAAQQCFGRQAHELGGVGAGLHHPLAGRVEAQQETVGLNGAGNVNGFAVAVSKRDALAQQIFVGVG